MKAYWDSSALVETHLDANLHNRLKQEGAFTRTHALAEIFSTLTGGRFAVRVDANQAAKSIQDLARYLDFVDVPADEVMKALAKAQSLGIRGGRVHDYIHALAAEKAGAGTLLTLDKNDFVGMTQKVSVEQV